jgi:hypothetical protein
MLSSLNRTASSVSSEWRASRLRQSSGLWVLTVSHSLRQHQIDKWKERRDVMPHARKTTRTTSQTRSRRTSRDHRRGPRQSGSGRARVSPQAASKLQYAKWIESPADHEDRKGSSFSFRSTSGMVRRAISSSSAAETSRRSEKFMGKVLIFAVLHSCMVSGGDRAA